MGPRGAGQAGVRAGPAEPVPARALAGCRPAGPDRRPHRPRAGQLLALVLVLAVVAVAVVVLLRAQRAAPGRRRGAAPGGVLGRQHPDRRRTPAAGRRRRWPQGQYDEAVREWMRAIARRLDERALLDPRPGSHGRRAGRRGRRACCPRWPASCGPAPRVFDDVTYGSIRADAERADQLRRLDAAVEAARPERPRRAGRRRLTRVGRAGGPMTSRRRPLPTTGAGAGPSWDGTRAASSPSGSEAPAGRWSIGASSSLAVLLTFLVGGQGNGVPLDPEGAGPDGARALAQVLGPPRQSTSRSCGPRASSADALQAEPRRRRCWSARPDRLGDADVDALTHLRPGGGSLVLVAPDQRQLDALAPGVRRARGRAANRSPTRAARRPVPDGRARPTPAGSPTPWTRGPPPACYAVGGHPSYVVAERQPAAPW